MVAGRFVNAYSTNDWMLGVAFRARYALPASIVLMLNMSSTAAVWRISALSAFVFDLLFSASLSCDFCNFFSKQSPYARVGWNSTSWGSWCWECKFYSHLYLYCSCLFNWSSISLVLHLQVDVTEFIEGHSSYLWATQEILELLELDTYYPVFGHRAVKTEIWQFFFL